MGCRQTAGEENTINQWSQIISTALWKRYALKQSNIRVVAGPQVESDGETV